MWISLAIHGGYFLLLIFCFAGQRQIQAWLMPGAVEQPLVLAPYIILGDIVYLTVHTVLTVILVKKLPGNGGAVVWEAAGAILFGGCMTWLYEIGGRILVRYVGNLHRSAGLVCYNSFRMAAAVIGPIRLIAVTLLLLAIGMSIYSKLSCHGKIKHLLWGSLGTEIVFFVLMVVMIMFQNQFKFSISRGTELKFIIPWITIASAAILLVLHVLLTMILIKQEKQESRIIVGEILGVFMYSGIFRWLNLIFNYVSNVLVAKEGIAYLINYYSVKMMIDVCLAVRTIGISLFIICCGMTIYKKTMMSFRE